MPHAHVEGTAAAVEETITDKLIEEHIAAAGAGERMHADLEQEISDERALTAAEAQKAQGEAAEAAEADEGEAVVRVAMPHDVQMRRSQKRGISPEVVHNHEAAEAGALNAATPAEEAARETGSRIHMKMPAEVRRKRSQSREARQSGVVHRREESEASRPTANSIPVAATEVPTAQEDPQPEQQPQPETSAHPEPVTAEAAVEEPEKAEEEEEHQEREDQAKAEEKAMAAQEDAAEEDTAAKKTDSTERPAEPREAEMQKKETKQATKKSAKKNKDKCACCSTM